MFKHFVMFLLAGECMMIPSTTLVVSKHAIWNVAFCTHRRDSYPWWLASINWPLTMKENRQINQHVLNHGQACFTLAKPTINDMPTIGIHTNIFDTTSAWQRSVANSSCPGVDSWWWTQLLLGSAMGRKKYGLDKPIASQWEWLMTLPNIYS